MKTVLGVLGLTAACAACCAIPIALPMLAGLASSGAGLAAWGWPAAAALLAATGAVGMAIVLRNRKRAQERMKVATAGTCGCSTSDASGRTA